MALSGEDRAVGTNQGLLLYTHTHAHTLTHVYARSPKTKEELQIEGGGERKEGV